MAFLVLKGADCSDTNWLGNTAWKCLFKKFVPSCLTPSLYHYLLTAQDLFKLTWPLSSSSVSITMEQDFHSQIIRQKSSIVWSRGPWLAM